MNRKIFKLDKWAEDNGLSLKMEVGFYTSEDGKTMEILSCTIHNGCKSIDYAWTIGHTTLEDVIEEFLDNQD